MTEGKYQIEVPPGCRWMRIQATGGASSDGNPGESVERVVEVEPGQVLDIEIGRSGSPDAPPGTTTVTDLSSGRVLVIAPPIEPYWEP